MGIELSSKSRVGVIVNYRRGPKTQRNQECIVWFPNTEFSSELVGRTVAWPVGNRKIRGKIVGLHGKRGQVKVRFRKGVPGQALGTAVEITG